MYKVIDGWNLPPGVTPSMIDEWAEDVDDDNCEDDEANA